MNGQEESRNETKEGRNDERKTERERKRERQSERAMKQMATFAKMDLFTNKCSLCQHLLQSDLRTETKLTALICSSLCK